jgi:hypothetical protein
VNPTTEGRYRVYPGPEPDTWRLRDVDDGEPLVASAGGTETVTGTDDADPGTDEAASGGAETPLHAGALVVATLSWTDGEATVERAEPVTATRFHFVAGAETVPEIAEDLLADLRRAGEPVVSETTRDTDNRPNGAVYLIAEQGGERDVFAALRRGAMTVEPFVERLQDGGADPPHAAVLVDFATEPAVGVFLAGDRDGRYADALVETFVEPA